MFIMLTGSSGVGKNTLINDLRQVNSKIALMPTLTTRVMRPGEVEGDPFFFLSKEEFQNKIRLGELFEHEFIHGNYYGSSKIIFNDYIQKGNILMKDIGVEGAVNLGHLLKGYTDTIKIFLTTKNKQVLVKRLKGRGEKDIKKRLKRYPYEQSQKLKFDFILLNKNKEQTLKQLNEILKNENKLENVLFTKRLTKLSMRKIKALAEEYKLKVREDAVKVCLQDGKIVLQNGHEKFIACILAGVPICKQVIERKSKKIISEEEQLKYQEYLKNGSKYLSL